MQADERVEIGGAMGLPDADGDPLGGLQCPAQSSPIQQAQIVPLPKFRPDLDRHGPTLAGIGGNRVDVGQRWNESERTFGPIRPGVVRT